MVSRTSKNLAIPVDKLATLSAPAKQNLRVTRFSRTGVEVAEGGFEPATFRLLGWRAGGLLHPAMLFSSVIKASVKLVSSGFLVGMSVYSILVLSLGFANGLSRCIKHIISKTLLRYFTP